MTIDDFWAVIEAARTGGGEPEGISERIVAALSERSPTEIRGFEQHRVDLMAQSYTWELWGAAYLVNGGCSDDGFEYFRSWLFTQGRRAFETATANPDSLARMVDDSQEVECEDFMYVASKAYEEAGHGEAIDDIEIDYPDIGEGWDFDDRAEMSRRYPALWARFGGSSSDAVPPRE